MKYLFVRLALWVICLIFFPIIVLPSQTHACSRGFTTSFEEEYASASAIFTGTVTKVEEVFIDGLNKKVTIQPDRVYKGEPRTFLLTMMDSDQCGAGFNIGEPYLFYAHGIQHLSVTVFDRFPMETAAQRIEWLERRKAMTPVKRLPGETAISANYRGGLYFYYGKNSLGKQSDSFIVDGSVYVPLHFFNKALGYDGRWNSETNAVEFTSHDFPHVSPGESAASDGQTRGYDPVQLTVRYNGIAVAIDGKQYEDIPEPFIVDDQLYVPLRAIAEKLGLRIAWKDSWSAVYIFPPFPEPGQAAVLNMKYNVNVGLGGEIVVDRLTSDEITYRHFHGHLPEGEEVKPETVPFNEMLKEEIGIRKYIVHFFVSSGRQEVPLLLSPELVKRIETDADFRSLVGEKLGKPLERLPEDWMITESFFE